MKKFLCVVLMLCGAGGAALGQTAPIHTAGRETNNTFTGNNQFTQPLTVGPASPNAGIAAIDFIGCDFYGMYAAGDQLDDICDPATGLGQLGWSPGGSPTQRVYTTGYQGVPYADGQFFAYNVATGLPEVVPGTTFNSVTGAMQLTSFTFAALGASPLSSAIAGSMVYCSNCKNVVDDSASAGAACLGSGHGSFARRENSRWDCN